MDHRRYPIGRFQFSPDTDRARSIDRIEAAPTHLRQVASGLSDAQLDTPYRDGGWTARQVVHHVPDSHINAVVRFKLALTEEAPPVKPYREAAWAELADGNAGPIEPSLVLLEALHTRWVRLLRSLSAEQWSRTMRHPEHGTITLDFMLQLYAWHGEHHVAHIRTLREQRAW